MHVAIVGCGHGKLTAIYEEIANMEEQSKEVKVELLIICGDFQVSQQNYLILPGHSEQI